MRRNDFKGLFTLNACVCIDVNACVKLRHYVNGEANEENGWRTILCVCVCVTTCIILNLNIDGNANVMCKETLRTQVSVEKTSLEEINLDALVTNEVGGRLQICLDSVEHFFSIASCFSIIFNIL